MRGGLARAASNTRFQALSVPVALALVYAAINFNWTGMVVRSNHLNTFAGQPLLWGLIAALALAVGWKGARRLQLGARLVPMAGLVGVFQLSALFLVGMFAGFGLSPYNREFPAFLVNIAYFATYIVGMELARYHLLRFWRAKSPALSVVAIGLIFAFISIPLSQMASLQTGEAAITFLGFRILPAAGEHLLATYIALMGGPLAAIAYRVVLAMFEWLSPVLPSPPWALSGLLGLAVPYVGHMAFRSVAEKGAAGRARQAERSRRNTGWLILSFVSVAIIWFGLGLFPYHPLVANGDSMSPSIHKGDLVILRSTKPEDVAVGAVIQYRIGEFSILHRVVELDETPFGARIYITKGDANSIADPSPVFYGQVVGKKVFTIPKLGWIGVLATKAFSSVAGLFP